MKISKLMESMLSEVIFAYWANFGKTPKIIIGKQMYLCDKRVQDTKKENKIIKFFGCDVELGNFDFGFYLE